MVAYEGVEGGVNIWCEDVVAGFKVPVVLRVNGVEMRVMLSTNPVRLDLNAPLESFELDRNFYMHLKEPATD